MADFGKQKDADPDTFPQMFVGCSATDLLTTACAAANELNAMMKAVQTALYTRTCAQHCEEDRRYISP